MRLISLSYVHKGGYTVYTYGSREAGRHRGRHIQGYTRLQGEKGRHIQGVTLPIYTREAYTEC